MPQRVAKHGCRTVCCCHRCRCIFDNRWFTRDLFLSLFHLPKHRFAHNTTNVPLLRYGIKRANIFGNYREIGFNKFPPLHRSNIAAAAQSSRRNQPVHDLLQQKKYPRSVTRCKRLPHVGHLLAPFNQYGKLVCMRFVWSLTTNASARAVKPENNESEQPLLRAGTGGKRTQ